MISFFVPGIPIPKGSRKNFICRRTGVIRSKDDNPKTKPWEIAIASVSRGKMSGLLPMAGPVGMKVTFQMPRRKGTPKSAHWHTKKPDVDKLERALLDGLKTGGVFVDDSQVCRIDKEKKYAFPGSGEIGSGPGVWVSVFEVTG